MHFLKHRPRVIAQTKQLLEQLTQQYSGQKISNQSLLRELVDQVEDSFVHLGLTQSQEEYVMLLIQGAVERSKSLYEQGLQLDYLFGEVIAKLESALGKAVVLCSKDALNNSLNF